MALIRPSTRFPSGISGWYIYCHIDGKLRIHQGDDGLSLEDVKFLRAILDDAIELME